MTLYDEIKEDEQYKSVINVLENHQEQQEAIDKYIEHFLKQWEEILLKPLQEILQNDEVKQELKKRLEE